MKNRRNLYINLHLKRKFWYGIYRLLMRGDARGIAGTIYWQITACDAYRYFAGRALLMTSKK